MKSIIALIFIILMIVMSALCQLDTSQVVLRSLSERYHG
jgi:hypothetical protein